MAGCFCSVATACIDEELYSSYPLRMRCGLNKHEGASVYVESWELGCCYSDSIELGRLINQSGYLQHYATSGLPDSIRTPMRVWGSSCIWVTRERIPLETGRFHKHLSGKLGLAVGLNPNNDPGKPWLCVALNLSKWYDMSLEIDCGGNFGLAHWGFGGLRPSHSEMSFLFITFPPDHGVWGMQIERTHRDLDGQV